MDVLHCLKIAVFTQCLLHNGLKCLLLALGRHGNHAAQQLVDQGIRQLLRVLGIVQKAVYIRIPVVKGRKQKALDRRFHQPVPVAVFNGICKAVVAQSGFRKLDGTDGALYKFVYIIRRVKHLSAVSCLGRDIVGTVDKDDIIIFAIVIGRDDLVIELLQYGVIL